ncbi:MAG: asparagine synthase (glutamine-hydrolyzing) [Byssovorax sp.]
MCGIAGILAGKARGAARIEAVRAMNEAQRHRGPDGEGTWLSADGRVAFGHRRLAIVDLTESGAQPMVHAERGLTITFNGEIYNHVELRERLAAMGHRFHGTSDTEVLLAAYARWGAECLRELNGMFAFAIWDEARRVLFCARDRFGEKPFQFALTSDFFAFASEAGALALLDGVDLAIDDAVLARGATRGMTFLDAHERTLLRGVRQLLPGQAMFVSIDGDRPAIERSFFYWLADPAARRPYGDERPREAARRLLDLLTDSVRLRLRADVPVGSCLSGGLDSSTIVSLIRRLEPSADLRTFTGRFPGDPLDEGRYAAMVVEASRTVSSEVEPSPERFEREAALVYRHAEHPIGGMSQFAQWCVFHLAKTRGVTVLLDGQGSDEQLGGYGSTIIGAFLGDLLAARRLGAYLHERRAWARALPTFFSWPRLLLTETPLARLRPLLRLSTNRSTLTLPGLFQRDYLSPASAEALPEVLPFPEAPDMPGHALSRTLFLLSFRTMLQSLLRFGDRLSMAHSREVRLPFCDHRIAEHLFSLPAELLVGDGQVKRVLRLAIDGLVPPAIVGRPKQGFVPPQQRWLVGPLTGFVRRLVEDAGPLAGRIDLDRARAVAHADEATRARDIEQVWDVMNLLAWGHFSLDPLRRAPKQPATAEPSPADRSTGPASPSWKGLS